MIMIKGMKKITIDKLKKVNLKFLYKYALKIKYGWLDSKGSIINSVGE